MSRCIPFPPPGYLWNGVGGEALIEILKLRKERAEAKKERRRRKEKQLKKDEEIGKKKHSHRRKHKRDRSKDAKEKSDCQKKRELKNHGINNINYTEEPVQPIIPRSMYDSSDNSRNIDKERMLWSQNGFHNRGRPTQIDFQLQKDQEPIANLKCGLASRLGKEQFCATSGISTFVTGKIDSKHGRELGGSPPAEIEFAAVNEVQTSSKSIFGKSGLLEMEREFRKLIVNWMPPSLQTENSDFDDQEWLFERTLSRTDTSKKMTANDQELYQGSYPHARYLPDADICALPYTIIF